MNQNLLTHIYRFSFQAEASRPWKLVSKEFYRVAKQFKIYYKLHDYLEEYQQAKWKAHFFKLIREYPPAVHPKKYLRFSIPLKTTPPPKPLTPPTIKEISHWEERCKRSRLRAKREVNQIKFEMLFGGRNVFNSLPNMNHDCEDLLFHRLEHRPDEKPIMKGIDGKGREFVSVRIPIDKSKNEASIHYIFIRESYWRLHHCCGNRNLLSERAHYLAFLIEPYGFNPKAFEFCQQLFTKILRKR